MGCTAPEGAPLAPAVPAWGHITRMKPLLIQSAPTLPVTGNALDALRAAAKSTPHVRRRLERLGLLAAAGRALRITGEGESVHAVITAVRAYAALALQKRPDLKRTVVTAPQLLGHLQDTPMHATVHHPDGTVLAEYRLSRTPGGIEATCHDRRVRTLSEAEFLKVFQVSVYTLSVRPLHDHRAAIPHAA